MPTNHTWTLPLHVGQRVLASCSSVAGKHWEPEGQPGTIDEAYVGDTIVGYFLRLDFEPGRLTFCKPDEVVLIEEDQRS
jgi:hypothetical protein